jgi:hypothetical protein
VYVSDRLCPEATVRMARRASWIALRGPYGPELVEGASGRGPWAASTSNPQNAIVQQ